MQVQALHGRLVLAVGKHLLGRDEAGLDDVLLVVDVVQEGVQRGNALAHAGFQRLGLQHFDIGGCRIGRGGQPVALVDWGTEIIDQLVPLAERLDALHGGHDHVLAVSQARASLHAPDTLPSARVLRAMAQEHGDSFIGFIKAQSAEIHRQLLALPWSAKQQARFEAMAEQSVHDQRAIETADTMPFEIYRQEYVSPERLGRPRSAPAPQTQATALPIP